MKTSLRALVARLAEGPAASLFAAETKVDPPGGAPVMIPRAKQCDLTSKINGRTYRVFVPTPLQAGAGKQYPAIYLFRVLSVKSMGNGWESFVQNARSSDIVV